MSKTDPHKIRVKTLRYHTFNGKPHEEGDVYDVVGDSIQTAEQYLETLKSNRMAQAVGDDSGPRTVEEVAEDEPQSSPEPKPETDKSATKKSTHVDPMTTADLKAEAASKTVEHRKPSKDVPTIKK